VPGDSRLSRRKGNKSRFAHRIAVDPGADGGKGDAFQAVPMRNFETAAVGGLQQFRLTMFAVLPDRSDRVDDMPGREPVAAGYLGVPGLAPLQSGALLKQVRSGAEL